jgi:hypothetical protein
MSPADQRTCGTCTMCCKVYRIADLNKQEGKWCTHCAIGSGCRIYDERPEQCRSFNCLWLQDATMAAEWKPEISKIVLSIYPATGFVYAQVDPGTPFAWRKEPYFTQLKMMAERLLRDRRHLLVFVNRDATLIMPTGPVPIGPMSPEDGFVVRETFTTAGKDYIAERVARAN